jgi:hypothetical protein
LHFFKKHKTTGGGHSVILEKESSTNPWKWQDFYSLTHQVNPIAPREKTFRPFTMDIQ